MFFLCGFICSQLSKTLLASRKQHPGILEDTPRIESSWGDGSQHPERCPQAGSPLASLPRLRIIPKSNDPPAARGYMQTGEVVWGSNPNTSLGCCVVPREGCRLSSLGRCPRRAGRAGASRREAQDMETDAALPLASRRHVDRRRSDQGADDVTAMIGLLFHRKGVRGDWTVPSCRVHGVCQKATASHASLLPAHQWGTGPGRQFRRMPSEV